MHLSHISQYVPLEPSVQFLVATGFSLPFHLQSLKAYAQTDVSSNCKIAEKVKRICVCFITVFNKGSKFVEVMINCAEAAGTVNMCCSIVTCLR